MPTSLPRESGTSPLSDDPLPDSIEPAIHAGVGEDCVRVIEHSIGIPATWVEFTGAVEVFVAPPHDLDVLLRHGPRSMSSLPEPGGFEGLGSLWEHSKASDLRRTVSTFSPDIALQYLAGSSPDRPRLSGRVPAASAPPRPSLVLARIALFKRWAARAPIRSGRSDGEALAMRSRCAGDSHPRESVPKAGPVNPEDR